MLQGYCQRPLAAEAQKVFTIATPGGPFTPKCVPEGVLKATAYFQSVMIELLPGEGLMIIFSTLSIRFLVVWRMLVFSPLPTTICF